eukprot:Rhum_TRINITY_DN3208_c0_g1::Rhum_TRINITY_DN3208_c0_g1_i1::g.10010::m.10010
MIDSDDAAAARAFVRVRMDTGDHGSGNGLADLPVSDLAPTQALANYLDADPLGRGTLGVCKYYSGGRMRGSCPLGEGCMYAHVESSRRMQPVRFVTDPVPVRDCSDTVLIVKNIDGSTTLEDVRRVFADTEGLLSASVSHNGTRPQNGPSYALVEYVSHHHAVAAMLATSHLGMQVSFYGISEQYLDCITQLDDKMCGAAPMRS